MKYIKAFVESQKKKHGKYIFPTLLLLPIGGMVIFQCLNSKWELFSVEAAGLLPHLFFAAVLTSLIGSGVLFLIDRYVDQKFKGSSGRFLGVAFVIVTLLTVSSVILASTDIELAWPYILVALPLLVFFMLVVILEPVINFFVLIVASISLPLDSFLLTTNNNFLTDYNQMYLMFFASLVGIVSWYLLIEAILRTAKHLAKKLHKNK